MTPLPSFADCDETGLPATCPDRGACPAAVNAFAAACGDFLDVPLNRGIQQVHGTC
eukprot:SAG31_NODE_1489_length_8135_cov_3.382558_6_plen_56_part_00